MEVYACLWGRSRGMRHGALVAGRGDELRPMAWWFWVLRDGARTVLVDCGCPDEELAAAWGIDGLRAAPDLLAGLDLRPRDVEAVVLSHGHWDHAGGLAQVPDARVFVRRAELDWWRREAGAHGLRRADLDEVLGRGGDRLEVAPDDVALSPWPGVRLMPGGAHTPGSQWVVVDADDGPIVLASDSAYVYDNVEQLLPIGACVSAPDNVAALLAMRALCGDARRIVPGHDPAVAERHPEVAPGVFRIR